MGEDVGYLPSCYKDEGVGEGLVLAFRAKCKGRPRKPLAEVLLGTPRCAPLRLALYKHLACRL